MDMDPGEGTSDGRVRRKANNVEMGIKQEPDGKTIKEESADGCKFGLVTRSNEGLAANTTSNVELMDESREDFILDFNLNDVKEEVKFEEGKPEEVEDFSADSGLNGNDSNSCDDQGDEPVNCKRLNSSGKGKKRDGSRKQNKRKIPRNKAAKKRKQHKCHVCGYVTSHKWNFATHIRIHKGDKPYKCNDCSKKFAHKSDLIRHENIHSGEKPFECSLCSKSFAQKNNLNVHLRTHPDELPYSCLKCGQRFSSDEANQSHEKRCKHRRYECYLCEYKCFAKGNLKSHMQAKHTGEHQFQCEICGKKFIHRGDLNQHLATHRNQYPFECSKCRLAFTREENKAAHEKICGRRQYQCYICKVFTFFKSKTTNLRVHMRAHHTGEKPFHCKWCKARFSHKSNANNHMKRRHLSSK